MTKQIITVTSIYPAWEGLRLPALVEKIQKIIDEEGPLCKFQLSNGYEGDDPEVRIDICREETPEEEALRLSFKAKQEALYKAARFNTYKQLKAEFGNE